MSDTRMRERVVADYLAGELTVRQIMAKHGVTAPAIYYHLRALGHENNREARRGGRSRMQEHQTDKLTNAQKQQIIHLYSIGMSSGLLAESYGVSRSHVSYLVRRWGPEASRRKGPAPTHVDHDLLWVQWPGEVPQQVESAEVLKGGVKLKTAKGEVRLLRVPPPDPLRDGG